MFSLKSIREKGIKILTPKQITQRLPTALPQVKADTTPENWSTKLGKLFILYIEQKKICDNVIK